MNQLEVVGARIPSVGMVTRAAALSGISAAIFLFFGCSPARVHGQAAQSKPSARLLPVPPVPLVNNLGSSSSPYLLEHAHDPVAWQPWGDAAFDRARQEGKPVFLTVGFSACHWCHVMQRQDFENADIGRYLNENFVCVAVDREQRPELDDIYLNAVELMTGSGGWPLSVFLTPDRKPFAGATYLGPSDFMRLLKEVVDAYQKRHAEVLQMAERVSVAMSAPTAGVGPTHLKPDILDAALQSELGRYDPVNGGFGSSPKFPEASTLAFLLDRAENTHDTRILRVVSNSLDHMAAGGVYDQIGGGFHRYSTDAAWRVPHFEKMLYDQALLIPIYLQAYRLTARPRYRASAEDMIRFTLRELHSSEGGFDSSMDADSEGAEGKYYLWTPAQVRESFGKDTGLFNRAYGVRSGPGELEGSTLRIAENVTRIAKESGLSTTAADLKLKKLRARALAVRERRPRPAVDTKVLASWNGLMIQALVKTYEVTHELRYLHLAADDGNFISEHMMDGGQLLHSWHAGKASVRGLLEDYAACTQAFVDLFEATKDPAWLSRAVAVAGQMLDRFEDRKDGGFFSSEPSRELIARRKDIADSAIPSANGLAAEALISLGRVSSDTRWRTAAARTISAFAPAINDSPGSYLSLLSAYGALIRRPEPLSEGVVRLFASEPAAKTGAGVVRVKLRAIIEDGWHISSHHPSASYLIPTVVRIEAPSTAKLLGVSYPVGTPTRLGSAAGVLLTYQHSVEFNVRFSIPGRTGRSAEPVSFLLSYQACNDRICLKPMEAHALYRPTGGRD